MITQIEDFFTKGCGRCPRFETPDCSTKLWSEGLAALRALCLQAGLKEVVKWGHPCYMKAGRNVAIIGAFRKDFRLTFFNAALMTDPNGVMEKQGQQAQSPDMFRFIEHAQVTGMASVILAYLHEAAGYAEAGIKPKLQPREVELPEELVEALDADPALAEAFHTLTPGRQRSYVIALAGAKAAATRVARIVKFRDKILIGKGANEY